MATKDHSSGIKSAYELALERLAEQGIAAPRQEALAESVRQEIAEARRQAQAKLAELEILHRDRLSRIVEPEARAEQEDYYLRERRRIESEREEKVARLRGE